jgi:hypothetical protein
MGVTVVTVQTRIFYIVIHACFTVLNRITVFALQTYPSADQPLSRIIDCPVSLQIISTACCAVDSVLSIELVLFNNYVSEVDY